MKIRFVTLYYPPEIGAAQRRLSELAHRLRKREHEVTVLTGFPNYPTGEIPEEYRGKLIMRENVDGVRIIRVRHYVAPNTGFARRLLIHLTFSIMAAIYTILGEKTDVVYCESPPLFNGFVALVGKWLRRIPYVFNVADLWPQTAVELGALKEGVVLRLAEGLETLCYRQAKRILAVTKGIQEFILAKGFDRENVPLITNGVDDLVFRPDVTPHETVLQLRADGKLLAVYAGTHGMAQALGAIVTAAEMIDGDRMEIFFIGSGPEKAELQRLAAEKQIEGVRFLNPYRQNEMPQVWRAANIAIISLRDLPLFHSAMPSKCFEAMAAGLPIMLAARGEMALHVRNAGCGIVADPENAESIAASLTALAEMPEEERRMMGRRGRAYVEKHFSRKRITGELEQILLGMVKHES